MPRDRGDRAGGYADPSIPRREAPPHDDARRGHRTDLVSPTLKRRGRWCSTAERALYAPVISVTKLSSHVGGRKEFHQRMRLKRAILAVASGAILAVAECQRHRPQVLTSRRTASACTDVAWARSHVYGRGWQAPGTRPSSQWSTPAGPRPASSALHPAAETRHRAKTAVDVDTSGSQEITNIKNGRARVNVSTADPTVTPEDAGCQNNNWGVLVSDVEFTNYTLTISQGGVTLFTCTGASEHGRVAPAPRPCTSA